MKLHKTIITSIAVFSLYFALYCQESNTYPIQKIMTFDIGKCNQQLGYDSTEVVRNGPSGIGFSNRGYLYILDYFNHAIKIYTKEGVLKKPISIDDETWCPIRLRIIQDVIYGLNNYRASFILNDGKVRNFIFLKNSWEPINVVILYNFYYSVIDNKIKALIINPREINGFQEFDNVSTQKLLSELEMNGLTGLSIDKMNRLLFDGTIETMNYKTFIEYYLEKNGQSDFQAYRNSNIHKFKPINTQSDGIQFLGKDIKKNVYWDIDIGYILIFNKDGYVLDFVKYNNSSSKTQPAIHPSGDVYILDYDKNGVYLNRIKNVWDKVGRAFWHETNATVTAPIVRLRKKPSLTGEEAGYLQIDERVIILGKSTETITIADMNAPWYRVKTINGVEAWVYGGYIEND